MRSGITRQALRRHRWSLLGPAATQALGGCVIGAMLMTAKSIDAPRLTAADRAAIAAADLPDTVTVFLGDSVYLSVLIVGVTMNLAIGRQLRDIALLRTIGARPAQIRRSVTLQAALVAVPAALLGVLAAVPAGYLWTGLLRGHGVLPAAVRFEPDPAALPIVAGIALAASVAGAWIASWRASRIAPLAALTETAAGRRGVGRLRAVAGLTLIAAGVTGSALLARYAPDQAGDAALFVLLAECVGAGLVGPVVLRRVAAVLRRVARRGLPRLAVDNVEVQSRPLAGTLIPLVLAVAFALIKVAVHTTPTAAGQPPDPAADLWTDYSGTAVFFAFAAVAALNTLITVSVGRGPDLAVMQLAGGSRRDLLRMVALEGAVVAATALVLAGGIAFATLAPILQAAVHTPVPSVPGAVLASGTAVIGALVAAGTLIPAAVLTRRPPVQALQAAGRS